MSAFQDGKEEVGLFCTLWYGMLLRLRNISEKIWQPYVSLLE